MNVTPRMTVRFTINDRPVELEVQAGETALSAIRDRLGLTGTKEGCGNGECGACVIILDGVAVNACLTLAAQLDGRRVLTVEGLEIGDVPHPLQEAFVREHAVQCGFCTPGLLMSAKALLDANPRPDRKQIVEALSGNVCRCTGYGQIVSAVEKAAARMAEEL